MTKRDILISVLTLLLVAATASASIDLKADRADGSRSGQMRAFAVGPYAPAEKATCSDLDFPSTINERAMRAPRPVGSAQSSHAGIGIGESVDRTWDDVQIYWHHGRRVSSYSNGTDIVDIHFAYVDDPDTLADTMPGWLGYSKTAYNVFSALDGGDWPRGQDAGCELESVDPKGAGSTPSMDLLEDGRVVIADQARLFSDTAYYADKKYLYNDNMLFVQASQWDCSYNTQPTFTNVTRVDSSVYKPTWIRPDSITNWSRIPQVITQWDGDSTVVHILLEESAYTAFNGPTWLDGEDYHVISYFRGKGKGMTASTIRWDHDNKQIIDTIWFVWASMTAAPYPEAGVAVAWTDPSYWGAQLNKENDIDIWYRESTDRGLSWGAVTNATNFQNAIANDPAHFTAWVEVQALYTSDGNLHLVFPARPTSADPHFDGYNFGRV